MHNLASYTVSDSTTLTAMNLKLITIALALAACGPVVAANALAPLQNAVPLYAGFKGVPLETAQRTLSEVTGSKELAPKDFVTFDGYDEKLFSAFGKLPARRTQTADFTACTEVGTAPIYNRRITKGVASALDYSNDGFTAEERAAIEKTDSRMLHYVQVPTAQGQVAKGVTQYLDFNNVSSKYPTKSDGINLRIGTLEHAGAPIIATTKCARLDRADAVFSDEVLREAAETGEAISMEDKNGVRWAVRKSPTPGKWLVTGPGNLPEAVVIKLFEDTLAHRAAAVKAPWHLSRTETFKGVKRAHLISFAMFAYDGGKSETMTLLVADGKARLGWSVTDPALGLATGQSSLPPAPPTTTTKSFDDYAAAMSPAGNAAMHLMQIAFECPTAEVAKGLNKEIISSRVLYETLGVESPSGAGVMEMPQAEFQKRVMAGIDVLKGVDETDVSTLVNCGVTAEQVSAWKTASGFTNPDFVLFMKRMETISQ